MEDPRQRPAFSPPNGIRLAEPEDFEALLALLLLAHAENSHGGLDRIAVHDTLRQALSQNHFVMAVVPGETGIEAVIGLQPNRPWWGDATTWYYSELLVYVHPACRKSRHFAKLMGFARYWADAARAPVILDVHPAERLGSKLKAFGRHGTMIGASFLIGSREPRYLTGTA